MANRLGMYSVYDVKAENYGPPFFVPSEVTARRMFEKLASDGESMVSRYPDEFKLVHLGFFDSDSGKVETLEFPESKGFAREMKAVSNG